MKSHINKILKKCRNEIRNSGGTHSDNALNLLEKAVAEMEMELEAIKTEADYHRELADIASDRLNERTEAYDYLNYRTSAKVESLEYQLNLSEYRNRELMSRIVVEHLARPLELYLRSSCVVLADSANGIILADSAT